ncbi:MAG: PQQ-like beta-propeller repeat protein, partial [Chloroflexi bacterium]|nr:PQQ-like beta-propeller repeat protein [Chloroflexota bacterium]
PRWSYATQGGVNSSPRVAGGALYFGSTDGHLYCLDASNGNLRWRFATGGPIPGSPTIAGNLVFLGSMDHHLYALPV